MRGGVISGIFVVGAFLQTALPPIIFAQTGHDAKKTTKPPRALGLLELAPNGTAHLIPITILIDGKYYDASAYKAAPVPMALWSETVYEAFRSGVSQGLFTVTGALQRQGAKDATEWMGEGTWQTADSIKTKVAKKKTTSEPRGMNEDEGPPVLRRGDKPKSTEPPTAPTTQPQTPPVPAASPNATPAAASPAAPTTKDSTSSSATPAPQEPAHEDQAPEDKERPTLKRGKPAPLPPEPPQKASAAPAKTAGHNTTTPPTSAPSGTSPASQIQRIPAISASNGPDPRSYIYSMKPEEEQQFRKKMLAMAAEEVRARAAQLASGGSAPVHATPQRGKATAVKPVQPDFEDVQLRVFDLANSNEPELVLTANAHMPPSSRGTKSANPELEYMVTFVAREDVNGDLHKALANLTDTGHLDVLPRLELIDAVDVDGDGRGELLFRQVSGSGSAFAVYRVIGDRLYPLFQGAPGG
jgi:hypothetical protein